MDYKRKKIELQEILAELKKEGKGTNWVKYYKEIARLEGQIELLEKIERD